MTDAKARLRTTLEELRQQLGDAETIDPAVATRLRATIDDVERAMGGQERHHEAPLGERLSDAARSFEATHPTLAGTISSVIDALARMGI